MLEKKDHYTGRELWNDMPEWKRKKDVHLCRYFFRPISFYISSGVQGGGQDKFLAVLPVLSRSFLKITAHAAGTAWRVH